MTDFHPPAAECHASKTLLYAETPDGLKSMIHTFPISGYNAVKCTNFEEAKEYLASGEFGYLFSDLTEHDPKGQELVEWARRHCPQIRPFLYANPQRFYIDGDYWLLNGDGCFCHKGVGTDDLTITLSRMFNDFSGVSWVGVAKNELNRIRKQINGRIGEVVLLEGEHGTARASLARLAHFHSCRKYGKFAYVECEPVNKKNIENFDIAERSFDDSLKAIMRESAGGSVYFHHVDRLPLNAQKVLLRHLKYKPTLSEEGKYPGVVSCSMSGNPADLLTSKKIQRELFDLLQKYVIKIPPVREYRQNIEELAKDFNHYYSSEHNLTESRITKGAMEALKKHPWDRNIREFFEAIKDAATSTQGKIIHEYDLKLDLHFSERDTDDDRKRKIKEQLKADKGNKTKVADFFGIARKTLYEWMEKYGIPMDFK